MRITKVDHVLVRMPFTEDILWGSGRRIGTTRLICRIETDAGITGWGETISLIAAVPAVFADVVAPLATFSQAVTITGLLTFVGGMVGSAASGAAAVFNGILNVIGQITANGKRVDDTHTHNNVQPGSGNSGTVN